MADSLPYVRRDWGLPKLYERLSHESERGGHADALIRRVLFLDGTPDMSRDALTIGNDVISCLEADLALEYKVRADLAKACNCASKKPTL